MQNQTTLQPLSAVRPVKGTYRGSQNTHAIGIFNAKRISATNNGGSAMTFTTHLTTLSDPLLLESIRQLMKNDRLLTVDIICHLAEVEYRELHLGQGYSSMFAYSTKSLKMEEAAAYRRITAARLCRKHPLFLGSLKHGELSLSVLLLLAPHLTKDNQQELLSAMKNLTKREAEKKLACLCPKPLVPARVRKLPRTVTPLPKAPESAEPATASMAPGCHPGLAFSQGNNQTPVQPPPKKNHDALEVLSATRYKVQFSAGEQLYDKLQRAKQLMSHSNPTGDLETIFGKALDLLVENLSKKKIGPSGQASKEKDTPNAKRKSRYIAKSLRRKVYQRDGGQCTFRGPNGKRCCEKRYLEFHHVKPFAMGGPHELCNITTMCKAHNQYLARQDFGQSFITEKILRSLSGSSSMRPTQFALE
jgi:hypothetical protein